MKKAAAVIIQNKTKDKVFLVRRSEVCDDEVGKWESVAGSLEENEDFETAVRREAMEEVAVELSEMEIFSEEKGEEWHVKIFRAIPNGEPKIVTDEATESGWFTKEELKNLDLAHYAKKDFVKLGWFNE